MAKRQRKRERQAKTSAADENPDAPAIQPAMSEQQLRDAGVAIDLPYEGAESDPQPLRYGPDDDGDLERTILDRIAAARGDGGDSA